MNAAIATPSFVFHAMPMLPPSGRCHTEDGRRPRWRDGARFTISAHDIHQRTTPMLNTARAGARRHAATNMRNAGARPTTRTIPAKNKAARHTPAQYTDDIIYARARGGLFASCRVPRAVAAGDTAVGSEGCCR